MSNLSLIPDNWEALWQTTWSLERKLKLVQAIKGAEYLTAHEQTAFNEMQEMLREEGEQLEQAMKDVCPPAFFTPSYDQAQKLNAWHPDYDKDNAPNGYNTVLDFTCNRRGKTAADIIDVLLWIIPNDPDWPMFQELEDEFGRGKYTVQPRPDWKRWKRTGKMFYPWLTKPPMDGKNCHIWHGCPNQQHWKDVLAPEYRKWLPPVEIARTATGEAWSRSEFWFETRWGHKIQGKLYESDVLSWAGKACWMLKLDEAPDKHILSEALPRVQAGGYMGWSYTPAEARNLGSRAQLAFECYTGKYPLVGKVKSFTNFGMDTTPDRIMPQEKKDVDRKRYERLGDEGQTRMKGGFFTSSPVVFNHFDEKFHVLEMDGREILERWPDANLSRGIDEGIAHPAACIWGALLRTGELIIYRDYQATNKSIGERVKDIVELSGNEIQIARSTSTADGVRHTYKEKFIRETFRATFADWHLWNRKNEQLDDSRAKDYQRAGMIIRQSTMLGPEARCDNVNDMFRKDHTRLHVLNGDAPGARIYVTRNCVHLIERLKNYLWAQKKSGPDVGEFTGKPQGTGDDVIDAFCYQVLGKLRWHSPKDPDDNDNITEQSNSRSNPVTGYARL